MSHDPGLLLVDKRGQPHVMSVELSVTLEPVTHAKATKEYRAHSLLLYTDNGDHALLVATAPVQPFQTTKPFTFYVQVQPRTPTLLLCRWFAHAPSKEDHAWALEMVASGASATGDEITLLDIASTTQAVVQVKGWPWREEKPSPTYAPHPLLAELDHMVREAYTRVPKGKPSDVFVQVQVHLGLVVRSMPVLFFALLARRMQATPQQATAYFEHVLRVATALSADRGRDEEQLLADTIALPSLCWAYRADKTRTMDEIDQWSSLWAYPASRVVAFDCEDGSIALMQLFMVLQSVELVQPSAALKRMQTLAKTYKPWLAINELRTKNGSAKGGVGGDGYVLHCCLLLLPIQASSSAPISIESTARISGPWRVRDAKSEGLAFTEARARARKGLTEQMDGVVMHQRTPMGVVRERKVYGRLVSLVSCAGSRAQHVLMRGVDTATYLTTFNSGYLGGVVAVDIPVADLEKACARELQLTPTPRFPVPPPSSSSLDDIGDSSIILPAFASAPAREASTRVRVTADMDLFVFRG